MGEGKLELSGDEKRRILAGDSAALKRDEDPGDVEGLEIVLREQKARREPIFRDRFPGDREGEFDKLAEIPAKPLVWIVAEKATRHRKGHWLVSFKLHDEREPTRRLGPSAPATPGRSGLHTRQNKPKPRGADVQKFTPESERGYGGPAIDDGQAVDDDDLAKQRVQADERWARHMQEIGSDEERRRRERSVRSRIREAMEELDPQGQAELLAGIERQLGTVRERALDKAA